MRTRRPKRVVAASVWAARTAVRRRRHERERRKSANVRAHLGALATAY